MKTFIVYDSFALACKANEELQRADESIGGGFHWNVVPCHTRSLCDAVAGWDALTEARDANLLVFAWHESTPFLSRIGSWLESWARSRTVPQPAIGILSESNNMRKFRAFGGLWGFATRHGLGLILSQVRFPEFRVSGPVLLSKLTQLAPALAEIGQAS